MILVHLWFQLTPTLYDDHTLYDDRTVWVLIGFIPIFIKSYVCINWNCLTEAIPINTNSILTVILCKIFLALYLPNNIILCSNISVIDSIRRQNPINITNVHEVIYLKTLVKSALRKFFFFLFLNKNICCGYTYGYSKEPSQ